MFCVITMCCSCLFEGFGVLFGCLGVRVVWFFVLGCWFRFFGLIECLFDCCLVDFVVVYVCGFVCCFGLGVGCGLCFDLLCFVLGRLVIG